MPPFPCIAMNSTLRQIYRVARGLLFTAIIFVAVVYLAIYVMLSVPSVQNRIKDIAEREASAYIGSDVEIGTLLVYPFNEVVLKDVAVKDKAGKNCLKVQTIGAGIRLMKLINSGRIELTYSEIIGLDANIYQSRKDSALNIQFLIDAFKPKDQNKPPKKFDVCLRNVVIRRGSINFNRDWVPVDSARHTTDFNHLRITGLNADLYIPELSNDLYEIDLRRLAFEMSGGLKVETLALKARISPTEIVVKDFVLKLPGTELRPSDISLPINGYPDILPALTRRTHKLVLVDNPVTPADFSWLADVLGRYSEPVFLSVDIDGNAENLNVNEFKAYSKGNIEIFAKGEVSRLDSISLSEFAIDRLSLKASAASVAELTGVLHGVSHEVGDRLRKLGDIDVDIEGKGEVYAGRYDAVCKIATSIGSLEFMGNSAGLSRGRGKISGNIDLTDFHLGAIAGNARIGAVTATTSFSGDIHGKDIDGEARLEVENASFNGRTYGGVTADVHKEGKDISGSLSIDDEVGNGDVDVMAYLGGELPEFDVNAKIRYFHPDYLGMLPQYEGYVLSGLLTGKIRGNSPDNITGNLTVKDLDFYSRENKSLTISNMAVEATADSLVRTINLKSDWIDGEVRGHFRFAELGEEVKSMLSHALPSIIPSPGDEKEYCSDAEFSFLIKPVNQWTEFFNLPFRLLVDVPVKGSIDGTGSTASFNVDIPFLQQGKNKLVRDTKLDIKLDGGEETGSVGFMSTFPAKKGDVSMVVNVMTQADNIFADVDWETPSNKEFNGKLTLDAEISKDEFTQKPEVSVEIHPSRFDFGVARWDIDRSNVVYDDGILRVDGLKIWHGNQFVDINGVASANPEDSIAVELADIDVGYIFDTLNINYVSFGGIASGTLTAAGALGEAPVASTDNLIIRDMSYNGSVLGDGHITSRWDNDRKMVGIAADIVGKERSHAVIDGGIWVTRDSLSFLIDADRTPVGFLAPFMSAFATEVTGRASGTAKLYGTFSDIDLEGRILADSIAIKLGFTNVAYHGTDSVVIKPGLIDIPSFRLYDKFGNSAILTGKLTHRYFHEPEFDFRVTDARRLLCFDTNSSINPDWYGTIFGTGRATVKGWPGTVSISADMTATENSSFTFVLNDTQAAEEYRFLTFSDRRKEMAEKLRTDTVSAIISAFKKKMDDNNSIPSRFMMDLRGTIAPSTLMTLVMDPIAGDKITARGNGNLQMDYDSESDLLQMFGKYTLEEGNYNFSLQDLILRDFKIRGGSSISFNGDPFNARLDITATYRVNTNLTDLDKSFATDREIARTNVPVDALLMVKGEMMHPDITFDIALPTLTQDVERKVKSIISTDDMMSRQIIYLLALNRFYTPEYMGTQSNGGEFASVASSTLSSQLQNMLGQLTDKFTVSPAFRSDKGDFSDIEVDVALSSRLLNNRLIVNGNFGYRDRTTSSTTFVGDFDIEYLLNRSGNLRLKAYNHFNDQNYYLRQALTTQGLGIIYRRDFDNPFTFLRKIFNKKKDTPASPADSVSQSNGYLRQIQ